MTHYDVVKVYGRVGLFIEKRLEHIPNMALPANHFVYDLRHADDDDSVATVLAKEVTVNRMGSIIVKRPIMELENNPGNCYITLTANDNWKLSVIEEAGLDLNTFAELTEFQAATNSLEYPIGQIMTRLGIYIDAHPDVAVAGSEYAMTNTTANQDAMELVMDILDLVARGWDSKNFMPESPEGDDTPADEEIATNSEVNIQEDIFDIAELFGNRVLLLTKPFATTPEHVGYAVVNGLLVYDLYYIPTDPEQMERVRIIQAQAEKSEGYYGTILTKYEIPGAGTDTADDGSIHVNVANIVKCGAQMQPIRATVQQFVSFYEGSFFVPPVPLVLQLLNQHGAANLNHVYYGTDGIKDTNEDMDSATATMCRIFDEYRKVNLDIDPASRPALISNEE